MNAKSGEYEGRVVGKQRLDCLLGVRGNVGFYLSKGGERGNDQLVEVAAANAESADLTASWSRAQELSHANLLRVHASGRAELEGGGVAYAVLDMPEDDLGEMVAKRKLDETAARATFLTVAKALQAIHQRELAHGAIAPSNVFMVQGQIRLSADTLTPAGKGGKERDLRQLAATIVKAMTACPDESLMDAPAITQAAAQLPAPFKQIVIGCAGGSSNGTWTAARIVETLSGRSQETAPRGEVAPRSEMTPRAETTPRHQTTPVRAAMPGRATARQPVATTRAGLPWPIWAGAAVLVLLVLFYAFPRGSRTPTAASPARQPVPSPTPTPAVAVATRDRATPKPAAPEPAIVKPARREPQAPPPIAAAPPIAATPPAPKPKSRISADSWAVIAGTYNQFEAAQKHAKLYHEKFPELQPHVFPHEGQGKRYLIVLGSGLTQEAAGRLRHDVVEQGAPQDTYVTKIAED